VSTIARGWDEYRSVSRRYWLLLLTGVLAILVAMALAAVLRLPPLALAIPGVIAVPMWLVWLMAWRGDMTQFACPRCGEMFFSTDSSVNELRRTCVHCGLEKGRTP